MTPPPDWLRQGVAFFVPVAVALAVVRGWAGRASTLATVLDLARRGYVEVGGRRIERRRPDDETLLAYERLLLDALLDGDPRTRLPQRMPEVRTAIEAEAAARGLLAGDPRTARRRAAFWFGGFGLLAAAGMAVSVAFALGAFAAAILVAIGTARVRRTPAGQAEAGRFRALAALLARQGGVPPERAAREPAGGGGASRGR